MSTIYPSSTTLTFAGGVKATYKKADLPWYHDKLLAQVKSTYEGGWDGGVQPFGKGLSRPSATGMPAPQPPKIQSGLPDTINWRGANVAQDLDVVLTEKLQWFWYNILYQKTSSKEQNDRWWISLLAGDRWVTNKFGSLTHASYPTGTNLDKEDMKFFTLMTGNTIIELVSDKTSKIFGDECYPFKVIDVRGDLSQYSPSTHPFLFYQPMNSVRTKIMVGNKWTGKFKEDGYARFPQYNGKAVTPMFMANTNIAWIRKECVTILDSSKPLPPTFNM